MQAERTITKKELQAATDWLHQHCRSRRVVVAYHADPDGVVAATFVADYLGRLGAQVAGIAVRTHEFDFSNFRRQLDDEDFDALVTVDINFASKSGFLTWLANDLGKPALIYDDHRVRNQPAGPAGFCYINPIIHRIPELPVPACFFAYLAWSGKPDGELDGAKLPDLVDVGLYGESVLPQYTRKLSLRHAPVELLRATTYCIYAFYASMNWPARRDPVLERLGALLATSADVREIVDSMNQLDAFCGGIQAKLDSAVRDNTDRILATGERHEIPQGGELVIGRIGASDFMMANLVASNVRNGLDSGVAIASQDLPSRAIVELRRTRDLQTVELDAVVERVSGMGGVINSGGHPPAAGIAVELASAGLVLDALRRELTDR